MRRKFFFLVVPVLVCFLSVKAQTNLSLNEAETQVVLQNNAANFSLVLENSQKNFAGKISLELMDVDDAVRASLTENLDIKSGKNIYKISLPLANLMQKNADKIAWLRLRYRITNAENQTQTERLISFSQIIKEKYSALNLNRAMQSARKPHRRKFMIITTPKRRQHSRRCASISNKFKV